jgi:hypothetical protein
VHDPFPLPCQGRNENPQDFELLKKFFLDLQKLVLTIAHQDEIINIDDNEKFDIFNLHNVHAKIHITPHKLDVFQENI